MWYENYLIKQACIEKEAIFPLLSLPAAHYAQRYGPQIKGSLQSAWESIKNNPTLTALGNFAAGEVGGRAAGVPKNMSRTVPNFGANLMQVPQYPVNQAANMQQADVSFWQNLKKLRPNPPNPQRPGWVPVRPGSTQWSNYSDAEWDAMQNHYAAQRAAPTVPKGVHRMP